MAQSFNPNHAATLAIRGAERALFTRTFNAQGVIATSTVHRTEKSFGQVRDGLSNTIALSESVTSVDDDRSDNPRAFVVFVNLTSGISNTNNSPFALPPSECRDRALAAGDRTRLDAAVVAATAANVSRGHTWIAGVVPRVGFTSMLPPNSPSCNNRNVSPHFEGWGVFSATSYHPGGVNGALLDASVRFFPESIDTGVLTDRVLVAGQRSPYGIWGALATISGGESVSF